MKIQVIKFGGSVITDPEAEHFFNHDTVLRLAEELPDKGQGSILIHGTGHVGKPPAAEYGYLESGHIPPESNLLSLKIKRSLRRLNQRFIQTLLTAGICAFPVDTASFFNDQITDVRSQELLTWLSGTMEQGLTPVFYGDLIPLASGGFQVFSSDSIALILSKALQPARMLFLSDVKGVYLDKHKEEDQPIKVLNPQIASRLAKADSDNEDVSGGMSNKVECALEISRYCDECLIASGLDPGIIQNYFKGKPVVGTQVEC